MFEKSKILASCLWFSLKDSCIFGKCFTDDRHFNSCATRERRVACDIKKVSVSQQVLRDTQTAQTDTKTTSVRPPLLIFRNVCWGINIEEYIDQYCLAWDMTVEEDTSVLEFYINGCALLAISIFGIIGKVIWTAATKNSW